MPYDLTDEDYCMLIAVEEMFPEKELSPYGSDDDDYSIYGQDTGSIREPYSEETDTGYYRIPTAF